MTFIDGYLIPVPAKNKDEYFAMAKSMSALFLKHGATRVVETWGTDVPRGKVTDFYMAVSAEENENVVFSFVEWPSKEVRDAGAAKVWEEPEMQNMQDAPFDGKRMIFGGFDCVVDAK